MPHEERIELRTIQVRLRCDCGGEMKHQWSKCYAIPPEFTHVCDKCQTEVVRDTNFPRTEFIPVPECNHNEFGHCIHPYPWDPNDMRREFTSRGWACRRCGHIAVPEQDPADKQHTPAF